MKTIAAVLMVLALALAGCTVGASGREIEVTAREHVGGTMSFEPKVVRVTPGEAVTFVVLNDGVIDHEFESPEAGIEEVLVPPGRSRRVAWTAPATPTSFPVYCDLPAHREAGMELTLTVE